MNILVTNTELDQFAGTQTYVFMVCRALRQRGHGVAAFSPRLGRVADAMRRDGLWVVDDLAEVRFQPDVIHGHHAWETTLAGLRWPEAGLLSFCHGAQPWQEAPCRLPWVHRYVVVGEPCRDRLRQDGGIPSSRIDTLLNFVDAERFTARPGPAGQPRRLLVLSNHIKAGRGLEPIEAACDLRGLQCRVVGDACGQPAEDPREALAWADVVIAQGRSALEAMACGRAVILGGVDRLGPRVTPSNIDSLRPLNFGYTCLSERMTPEALAARLASVNAFDTAEVTDQVRSTAGLDEGMDRLERLYADAWSAARAAPPALATVAASACAALAEATPAWTLGRSVQALHAQRAAENGTPVPSTPYETEAWVRRRDRDAGRLTERLARDKSVPHEREGSPAPSWRGRMRHAVSGILST